jgi:hypothetical protein
LIIDSFSIKFTTKSNKSKGTAEEKTKLISMDIANTIANDKHLCQIQQEMKVNFAKKAVANKTFASTE